MFGFLKRKPVAPPPLPTFDFEKDTQYLFSMIATYIESEKFKLRIHQKTLMTDNDITEISVALLTSVIESIAEPYRRMLTKYIPDEKIDDFIAEIIIRNMVEAGITINQSTV
jgi:type III secretory pathway component EscR